MRHLQRLIAGLVTLLCGLLLVSAGSPSRAAGSPLLGMYYGNQGWKMEQIQAVESWQGQRHAVVNLFTNWCNRSTTIGNLFTGQLVNIWNNKNVPMITWEPYLCSATSTPADVEVRAARGEYDAYITTWARRLKGFLSGPDGVYGSADDRRAYLRMGHEMNGDWYPWGAALGGNSPADYVAMWHHVRALFAAEGLESTRLQWIWCVNHDDVGPFSAEQYYPGDAAVDWVAIDGYNWGTSQSWSSWKTPAQSYDAIIARLRAVTNKPLGLTELASSSAGGGVAAKSQWIGDLFSYLAAKDLRMVVWFNEDKETDWAVFGGTGGDSTFKYSRTSYKAYGAYRQAVGRTALTSSDPANPRLLSDAQFAGQ